MSSHVHSESCDSHETDTSSQIMEVYNSNFEEEMSKISKLLGKYTYVSMDTEFPGVVYNHNRMNTGSPESLYLNIKTNVDNLKIIQLGITLADYNGNVPTGVSSWQFNFDFNMKLENYNQDSLNLLIASGINFNKLAKDGIPIQRFGEVIMGTGLILNDNIKWITYHGSYDMAYILKIITGMQLPDRLDAFISDLELYFPNFYDIRYLIKDDLDGYKLSLNKLAYDMGIERYGTSHQAGSDSLVTSGVFLKIRQNIINELSLINGRNKLFSLSNDCGEETYYYQDSSFTSLGSNYSYNNMNNVNSYQNFEMFNGITGSLNNNYQFYNMMMNSAPMKNIQNYVVPAISSNFNSSSSTASGNSASQQVPSVKKRKSKKEKKKKAQQQKKNTLSEV